MDLRAESGVTFWAVWGRRALSVNRAFLLCIKIGLATRPPHVLLQLIIMALWLSEHFIYILSSSAICARAFTSLSLPLLSLLRFLLDVTQVSWADWLSEWLWLCVCVACLQGADWFQPPAVKFKGQLFNSFSELFSFHAQPGNVFVCRMLNLFSNSSRFGKGGWHFNCFLFISFVLLSYTL